MKIKRMIGVSLAALVCTAACAWAELCVKCKDGMYTADIGKCAECAGETSSGAFKLCKQCSAKLGQCKHCRVALAPAKPAPGCMVNQGLTGKVIKRKGNFMPSIGGPRPGQATTPLAVPVHIFKGKIKPFEKPDPKHPALVQISQADKDGVYKIALPPGEYTVVAEINGKLYLNSFDGQGFWSTVEAKALQWITWNIEDTSEAVF